LAFSLSHYFKPALLLGLDIGRTAIRMVELSQHSDRGFQLERYAQLALPAGMVSDQHIEQPGQLAEHIAALAKQLGSKRKRVALALPAHTVVTRQMQVAPDIGEQTLTELITAEASGYLTVPPDQVRVDYQFNRGDAANIVLAAARREQVEDRIAAVEAAGLIPTVLDIDLYAAHAACVHAIAEPAPCALLMLSASLTQIALFDRHQLHYHRELPGCDDRNDPLKMAIAATRAIQLAAPAGMTLAHIFIGGESREPGTHAQLAQMMQAQSGISCRAAHPFAAMQTDSIAEATDADTAAYLVACGLAMRKAAS
jgi:type IV pilus assembly protein PilM